MTSIQREIRQSKPFVDKAAEATVALMRTADLVRRNIAAVLEGCGLSTQQYNVLRILRGAGAKGMPTLDIAERMIEETPGITRLIDRLEAKHLVARQRCKTDRRQVFCVITKEGLDLLAALDKPLLVAGNDAFGCLPKRDLGQLVALLDRAREGLNSCLANRRAANQRTRSRRPSAGASHQR